MLDLILKVSAFGGTALLAFMGTFVTIKPVVDHSRTQKIWLVCFTVGGLISFVSALWLSQRQDAELERRLTGGDNYVYLFADSGQLQKRTNPARIWVCSTGLMFDVKAHLIPFGAQYPAPEYFSLPGAVLGNVAAGCRWSPFSLPPGKYSIELDSRNGLAMETLKIIAPEGGPFTQECSIERDGTQFPTPECR